MCIICLLQNAFRIHSYKGIPPRCLPLQTSFHHYNPCHFPTPMIRYVVFRLCTSSFPFVQYIFCRPPIQKVHLHYWSIRISCTTAPVAFEAHPVGSCPSSSPPTLPFPIIWCRWNGYEYHSSTLSCPVRPPPLTPRFPYLFYTSLSTWLSVFLSISFLILVHLPLLLVRALRPFSQHVRATLVFSSQFCCILISCTRTNRDRLFFMRKVFFPDGKISIQLQK